MFHPSLPIDTQLARVGFSGRLLRSLLVMLAVAIPMEAIGQERARPVPVTGRTSLPIGMSTALSGPAADLGLHMRDGVKIAFAEYNRALPAGRAPLELIALDDGYEPERCAPNMRKLIDENQVVAIIGNVGTPTAIAAIPIANERRTPFFGAFTGAGVLRKDPPDRYVINFRASYAEETAAMVDALVKVGGLDPKEVAFFTQRDGYGDSGYNGGREALMRHGLQADAEIAHGRYERNTIAIEDGLAELMLAKTAPRAVIMVGSYKPCAELIKQAHALDFRPLFLNVSFVGPSSLALALGTDGEGVIVTQVVPHFDSELPLVREYRVAAAAFDPKLPHSFGSLEGYAAGRILCRAMASIETVPDREKIVDALLGLGSFDIGLGTPIELSPTKHQASHQVWPTILSKGEIVPFDWQRLPALLATR
ncbi:MAG: ABC transporter substrate-binding protein [Planctomycetota bacterium]